MNRRRLNTVLWALFVLLISAIAAQGASAAGTTGYTCKVGSGAGFTDAHCKALVGSGAGFVHQAIPNNVNTEGTVSNETTGGAKTSTLLKATIAGAAFTLTAATTTGTASGTNAEEGGEMYAHGEGTTTYTGVTATGGCKVFTDSGAGKGEEGVIHTEVLKATSKGQGDTGKLEPKVGTVFARFTLENCTNSGINGTYTVTGSLKCTPNGATINCTHAGTTAQNTLKLNGTIKAGIEATTTGKARANSGEAYTPVAATT